MKNLIIITTIILALVLFNSCSKKTTNPVEPSNSAGWTQVNDGFPANTGAFSLVVCGPNLFAGTEYGVFISTNDGAIWAPVNGGSPLNRVAISLAVSGTNLFASIVPNDDENSGSVFLSTNMGTSWTVADSGLNDIVVDAFLVSGTNIFAGSIVGVFLSTNNGRSWAAVKSGLPEEPIVTAFAASGNNLFVGTEEGVFLSTNEGTNWSAVNTSLTWQNYATALAVSGPNVFAGNCEGKVYLSTNNGTSWGPADSGLTDIWVNALFVSGKNLFLGTEGYVFLSTNNGTSWSIADSAYFQVSSFAVLGTNLFVGFENIGGDENGVWRRPLSEF